jgi:uncharacterized membrane protein
MSNRTLVLLILALGLMLRIYNIARYGSSWDEQISNLIANGSYNENLPQGTFTNADVRAQNTAGSVAAGTVKDNGNSIAYNIILHYWLKLFGNGDAQSRSLSMLTGLLMIPLAFRFSVLLFNNVRAAAFTALLFSIHPLLVEFSQATRAYSMGTFFCLWSTYAFYKIITGQATRKTYIIYTVTAALALLTHYLAVTVFLAHGIIFLLYVRKKHVLISYIVSGVIACTLFGAWMISGGMKGMEVMNAQNANYTTLAANFKAGDKAFYIPATAGNILTGWMQIWLRITGNSMQGFGLRIREIAMLLIIPFAIIILLFRSIAAQVEQRRKIIFLLIMTFIQTGFATILALKSGHCISFQPQYTTFIVPYAMLLLGYAITVLSENIRTKKMAAGLGVPLMLLMIISLFPKYRNLTGIYPDKNLPLNAAKDIAQQYQKGDIVKIKSEKDAMLINMYLEQDVTYVQQVDTGMHYIYNVVKGSL